MRASQPFFGKKPAAGRQNSGVSAMPPVAAQKKTHSWKTALRADGIVCPEGRFFCTIWEKRVLQHPQVSRQKSWQKALDKAGPLPPFQKVRCQRKRLTLIACGEPKGNRKAFGSQRTKGMTEEKPAKKANTYCLRRAKGKQKSLWPAANQRHDRRKNPCRSAPAGVLFYAVFARRRVMSPAPLRANPQGRITRTA